VVEGCPHRCVGPRWPGLWWTACLKHPDVPAGGVKQGVVGALDPSPTPRQRVVHPVTLATRGGSTFVRWVWSCHLGHSTLAMTLEASRAPARSEAAAASPAVGSSARSAAPSLSACPAPSPQTRHAA